MKKKLSTLLYLVLTFPILLFLGALKVKPIDASATKWMDNASRSAEAFATEAEASAEAWARNTAAAADTFHQAISAPGIKERFRRGVTRAGAQKFARKIRDVARDRFAPGVTAALADYKAGAEPYLQTIAGLTLSSRKPRGDPANYRRVEEVGKALNAKRLAMLGSGGG
ncbi:hypothetical protein LCGC14_0915670 [marine sediment metagenome]|uniref:Uncharacterized protein n=1 Tax=marine sediment metagenome TaxID=412755 RepID=A0A0F9NSA8_9ZZZZ